MEYREINPKKLVAQITPENKHVDINGYVIDNNDKTITLYIKNNTARTFKLKDIVIAERISTK